MSIRAEIEALPRFVYWSTDMNDTEDDDGELIERAKVLEILAQPVRPEFPCTWCGTSLDECGGSAQPEMRCCEYDDHPYRTLQGVLDALHAETTPLAQPRSRVEHPTAGCIENGCAAQEIHGEQPRSRGEGLETRLGDCEDALATVEAAYDRVEGLDVERLRQAIERSKDLWFGGDRDSWWMAEPAGMAADIAREYALLAPVEPEDADAETP